MNLKREWGENEKNWCYINLSEGRSLGLGVITVFKSEKEEVRERREREEGQGMASE